LTIIIKGFGSRARKVRLLYTIARDREVEKTRPGLPGMLPLLGVEFVPSFLK